MIPTATQGDHLKTAEAFLQFLATDKAAVLARTVAYRRLPVLLSALQDSTVTNDPILSQPVRYS